MTEKVSARTKILYGIGDAGVAMLTATTQFFLLFFYTDIALIDARKAVKMFEKVAVPVLGVVENMSTHICSQCGHEEAIFGSGGGAQMAADYGVELLGALPLDINIRSGADSGHPSVISAPDSAVAQSYREIARRVAARLSIQAKDYSARFPEIVIEND